MTITQQIATLFRAAVFGGNWTAVDLKATLADVTWEEAITPVGQRNTIATLVNHLHYYVTVLIPVLQGQPLAGSDALSFDHPPIQSQADWDQWRQRIYAEAETFAGLIEAFPEERLWEHVADPKYGHFYRNLHGVIEHLHYHLGQIVLLKLMLRTG